MTDHVRFSMMWVNDSVTHQRPMSSCRMVLRDAGGDAVGQSHGGLTCSALYLDQVMVVLRRVADIAPGEYQDGDDDTKDWWGPTTELYVRTSPGRRSVCYTLEDKDPVQSHAGSAVHPHASLVYTCAMVLVTMPDGGPHHRVFRPLRDLPVATYLDNVSELTVDLLWPLLQGKGSSLNPGEWYVPNYRIERVICDFTARV